MHEHADSPSVRATCAADARAGLPDARHPGSRLLAAGGVHQMHGGDPVTARDRILLALAAPVILLAGAVILAAIGAGLVIGWAVDRDQG